MKQKKYWQSFGELQHSESYQDGVQDEFGEDLPSAEPQSSFLEEKAPRRDFLKYLGFSTAAAAAAAAAAGGVPLYGFYRNGSVVMQRVV